MATLAEILRQTGYAKDGQLQAPTPTQPNLSTMSADYIRQIPQSINENQVKQMDMLARAFPDDTLKNADPKVMAEMAMQVPFNALTAFHGTPHKILGKFDINKVGTGEGAQAYGHGMYFAENPNVAKEYQKMLAGPEQTAAEYLKMYKTPEQAISVLQGNITPNLTAEAKKFSQDAIDVLKSGKELKGNLYKVDIPDADIPNMLDWDEPLSKQPAILEKLKGLGEAELSKLGINPDFTRRSTGKELTGESLYDVLTTSNSQKSASNLLAKQGIAGIRYFDQNSRITAGGQLIDVIKTPEGWKSKVKVTNRGGAGFQSPTDSITTSMPFKTEAEAKAWADSKIGSGTSNFVVFDPSTVEILEENAKPISRKALIEKQVKKLKD